MTAPTRPPRLPFRLLPYGERAVLLELPAATMVTAVREALLARAQPGITGVVAGARTLLIELDPAQLPAAQLSAVLSAAALAAVAASGRSDSDEVELRVRYDGADLASVAEQLGVSVDTVVERHTSADYVVQFCGFSPGFGYLTGLHPSLRLPRLSSPRPAVPAGSVAIADEFTGVYPRRSPGGWLLLGTTSAVLFDPERNPPALLRPGTRVRFRAT
ncbi:allophanate hydrolase subunit 1 [soil metagenome]